MATKPALILIPGLSCTEAAWAPQVAALGDLARPQVTGEHARHQTMAAIAEAILAQAPPRFVLAGLSMGGYIALEVMRRGGERVMGLALLDTSARPDTPEGTARRHDLIQLAKNGQFQEVSDNLLKLYIHPSRYGDAELVATVNGMTAEIGREGFLRQQTAIMSRPDSRPGLGRIGCPTTVICGRDDALLPLECSGEIAAAIPGAHLEIIEDSGHLTTLERPQATTAALRRWLLEARGAAA